jgi:glycosyltransferase involved in cell wall biosynthesis
LPGEFLGERARLDQPPEILGVVKVLCVSTLEPRKNHLRLLAALKHLETLCPELQFELNLVGNGYAGAMQIQEAVEQAARENPRIKWWRIVDDERLHELYMECHYTIYPSLIEGFGLPILESIWHSKPCICSDKGVMFELAQDGGCLATNVSDELCLAQALAMMANDHQLREKLTKEAANRPLKTWAEYGDEVLGYLHNYST